MSRRVWHLEDLKLGGLDAPDVVMVSSFTPVTSDDEALQTVKRKMRSHLVSKTSVEAVRIVDDDEKVIARWTYWDEQDARQRGAGSSDV